MSEIRGATTLEESLRTIVREEVATALRSFMPQGPAQPNIPGRPAALTPLDGFDPYSLVPYVEHVLREAGGGPLHAREIAEQVYALGFQHRWPPKHRDQLVRTINSLAAPSQHPELFERVAPRTLKLR
jgi:hypothetical protein